MYFFPEKKNPEKRLFSFFLNREVQVVLVGGPIYMYCFSKSREKILYLHRSITYTIILYILSWVWLALSMTYICQASVSSAERITISYKEFLYLDNEFNFIWKTSHYVVETSKCILRGATLSTKRVNLSSKRFTMSGECVTLPRERVTMLSTRVTMSWNELFCLRNKLLLVYCGNEKFCH